MFAGRCRLRRRIASAVAAVLLPLAVSLACMPGAAAGSAARHDLLDPVPGSLTAPRLQALYGYVFGFGAPVTNGARQRVYVIDGYDLRFPASTSDYRRRMGLPACTVASGCLQFLDPWGREVSALPAASPAGRHGLEVAEVVSAVCPNCAITMVSDLDVSNDLAPEFEAAIDTTVEVGAKYVVMPLNYRETTEELQRLGFAYLERSGVFYAVASGNDGHQPSTGDADEKGFWWPSLSPNVVAVGGVYADDRGGLHGRSSSSSACTEAFDPTEGQADLVPGTTCDGRAKSDVSGPAERIAVDVVTGGVADWTTSSGTSLAAAGVVALAALADQPSEKDVPPEDVYTNQDAFRDVETGESNDSTGDCTTRICVPQKGWDGPTGIGVPDTADGFEPYDGKAPPAYEVKLDGVDPASGNTCLGVRRGAFAALNADVRAVACDDPQYYVTWRLVRSNIGGPERANRRTAVRLVLESAENGDRRCLVVIDGGPPNMDGCRSADSADRWKTPLDRSLQSQASGKYLTAVAGERATLSATPQRIALDAVR